MRNKKRDKSFTLIELLVVIAIIGLISSIVLVSFKGTTGKAKIVKGLEFSHSIQHVLGSEAVGIWSFDDCPGGTANDSSGYGNNGTIYGASCTDDTPYKIVGSGQGKYALSFNGVNDYVTLGGAPSLEMGTGAITVGMWVKPGYSASYRSLFYGGATGGNHGYGTALSQNQFRYEVYGSTGGRQSINVEIGIQQDQWNHIVAVFDGVNNVMIAYLNGAEKHRMSISDPGDVQNSGAFIIGSHGASDWYFNGTIDEVRIYNQALSTAEIQQLYVKGLKGHKNLVIK